MKILFRKITKLKRAGQFEWISLAKGRAELKPGVGKHNEAKINLEHYK